MVKNHIKRLAAPRSWKIQRKSNVYVTRPKPGPHDLEHSIPLNIMFKNVLKVAKTTKEVKYILNEKNVLINGKKKSDHRLPVGLFDVIEFPELKEMYLATIDKKGKITAVKTETKTRMAKIIGKTLVGKKTMLKLFNGWNIEYDKKVNTSDSVIIDLKTMKVKKVLTFAKKAPVLLIGGKHIGNYGNVEDIQGNKVMVKIEDKLVETVKRNIFVVENEPDEKH